MSGDPRGHDGSALRTEVSGQRAAGKWRRTAASSRRAAGGRPRRGSRIRLAPVSLDFTISPRIFRLTGGEQMVKIRTYGSPCSSSGRNVLSAGDGTSARLRSLEVFRTPKSNRGLPAHRRPRIGSTAGGRTSPGQTGGNHGGPVERQNEPVVFHSGSGDETRRMGGLCGRLRLHGARMRVAGRNESRPVALGSMRPRDRRRRRERPQSRGYSRSGGWIWGDRAGPRFFFHRRAAADSSSRLVPAAAGRERDTHNPAGTFPSSGRGRRGIPGLVSRTET